MEEGNGEVGKYPKLEIVTIGYDARDFGGVLLEDEQNFDR